MKRIKFLSFCCIAVFLLTACGSSSSKNEEEKITVTGANGKEYTSYQEACRAEDFEATHKYLDILYDKYLEGYGSASDYQSYRVRDVREKYHAALNAIFKQEMMVLASDGSEQSSDKIVYLLTEIPEEGSAHPDGRYSWTQISEGCDDAKEHVTYCKWVTNYNSLCNQVLDLAISQDNQYLAKKVIKMYKQNVINEEEAYRNENSDDYKVKRTWADKEAAIAKCKEAGINLE
jgi:hypothetical protein